MGANTPLAQSIVMTYKDYVPIIVGFLAIVGLSATCGVGIHTINQDDIYTHSNQVIHDACIVHLHNAAKAMTVDIARKEIAFAITCLQEHREICTEDTQTFDDKLNILRSLHLELSIPPVSHSEEEALLQKTQRILFDGGQSCYKGNCQLRTYPFICPQFKTSLPR